MITIDRISLWQYSFSGTDEEISLIQKCLTVKHPNAWFIKKQRFMYDWDGMVTFFQIDKSTGQRTFYHGMLEYLFERVEYFEKKGEKFPPIKVSDFPFEEKNFICSPKLRPYQANAVNAILRYKFGTIKIPTRGGKTFTASEFMRQILLTNSGAKIFYFVDSIDLFNQTVKEIKNYFDGNIEIGEIKSGKVDLTKNITVVMVQTMMKVLSSKNKNRKQFLEIKKAVTEATVLIIDEVHEFSSEKRIGMIKKFKSLEYFLSLSATPYKESTIIENMKLQALLGRIIYTISETELIDEGFLADSKVFLLLFEHKAIKLQKEQARKYQQYQNDLVFENKERNIMLIDVIEMLEKEGYKILVLFSSVKHGKEIESKGGWKFIYGEDGSNERDIAKNIFLKGKGGVLLASNIFKKGITLPEVEIFINADGGLEGTNIIQKRGRVLGTAAGKNKAVIIDIMDKFEEYLSDHSINRLDVYETVSGKDKIEIFEQSYSNYLIELKREINKWMR